VAIRLDRDEKAARERDLVRRAKAGDVLAFERLYEDNVRQVYALCYRMAGRDRAEELTQDVFVRAWQKLGSFRGDSALATWLHPLTVNLFYSDLRARRRHTDRIMATDDLTPHEPALPPVAKDIGLDLDRALEGLPPGARQVFVLHDTYGYKHHEIAQMTGIAVGTSKAQLHRARRLLREGLSR
jgi:RNA polymerase sigma-70 factor (ECF subfamily)